METKRDLINKYIPEKARPENLHDVRCVNCGRILAVSTEEQYKGSSGSGTITAAISPMLFCDIECYDGFLLKVINVFYKGGTDGNV